MLKFLFFSSVVVAQDLQCNSTACPYPDDWKAVVQCGIVVSEDPTQGVKCAYPTKIRDRYPVVQQTCQNLELDMNGEKIKTGNLITINTMVENNRTMDHLNALNTVGTTTYYSYAFVGLRKTCQTCSFYWEDLEPVTFTNWYGSEPNTYYYDCTHIRTVSPYFGQWIDMSCSSFYHGICQFFPNGEPKIEEVVLPPKSGCKPGWWKFGGYCYLDFGYMDDSNQPKSYMNANSSCNQAWSGARMAMMPTREHNAMLASLMGPWYSGSDFWVGIYNWAYYDYYFSLDNKDKLTYANWIYGKPNHIQTNVDKCTIMKWRTDTSYHGAYRVGQWENTHCTRETYPWICSHEQSSEFGTNYEYPRKFILPDVKCGEGWIPYHSACYKLFTDRKNFEDAKNFCADQNPKGALTTTLITLWDEYELEFGRIFFRDDQLPNRAPKDLPEGYWLGLEYGSKRGDPDYSRWGWSDGFPLERSNWAGGHPTNPDSNSCGFMNQDGQFVSENCGMTKPFVCKAEFYYFEQPNYEETDAALGMPLPCDQGWTLKGHHCARVFQKPLPWRDAQEDCQLQGGNLGSLHSMAYNRWVQELYKTDPIYQEDWEGMWIGMSYKGPALGWQWEDQSPVSYTNWAPGEPNDWEGRTEDCVEMLKQGTWNDARCNETRPYYCKKIAETEFCAAAKTTTLKPCGFVGITEHECRKEWSCCYDPMNEVAPGQYCFKPKTPVDAGMAAGLAVGITIIVLGVVAGGYFAFVKFGNPFSDVGGGISNPIS